MSRPEAQSSDAPNATAGWHPDVECLLAALPELREAIDEVYDGWEHSPWLVYGSGFGRHLAALVESDEASKSDDARRAFAFLESLSKDGHDATARGEDRLRHDLAIEVLEAIDFAHLGRAYPLMGPATRKILEEMAAWNEHAHEQAQVNPERWIVENIESFRDAYRQAAGTLPEPYRYRPPGTA